MRSRANGTSEPRLLITTLHRLLRLSHWDTELPVCKRVSLPHGTDESWPGPRTGTRQHRPATPYRWRASVVSGPRLPPSRTRSQGDVDLLSHGEHVRRHRVSSAPVTIGCSLRYCCRSWACGRPRSPGCAGPKTSTSPRAPSRPGRTRALRSAMRRPSRRTRGPRRVTGRSHCLTRYPFVDEIGQPLTTRDLRVAAYRLMEQLGLRRVRLYDVRMRRSRRSGTSIRRPPTWAPR